MTKNTQLQSTITTKSPSLAAVKIGPDDPRYPDLAGRGANRRFAAAGHPDTIYLVSSTGQVVAALQEAVRAKLRVAVRSGGHCLEGFVSDPAVRILIDTSLMNAMQYDPEMDAFMVEAGATLGEVYRKLFLGWGAVLPAGISPNIGIGGHVLGGAFGFLSRQYGLAADHLYAVEVVGVDGSDVARSVVATREPTDPNRDLWWAHTGGGGGNFGIVTRYWFRSPALHDGGPANFLPQAPAAVLRFKVQWNWEDVDEATFTRLLRNHGEWSERNSAPGSPYAQLYSTLLLPRRSQGKIELTGMLTGGPGSDRMLEEYLSALNAGTGLFHTRQVERLSWLSFALYPFPDLVAVPSQPQASFKIKDAFLRRCFTPRQIAVVYHYLTRKEDPEIGGLLGMATYGGEINAVAPEITASAQRESILITSCSAGWMAPEAEAPSLDWVRAFYRELYAETGGVPVPGEVANGAFINHPDVDLADPQFNTSGVPWHTLYYKDNYPRLQHIKTRWDPLNIFHHALSIKPG